MKACRFVGLLGVALLVSALLQSQAAQGQAPYPHAARRYVVNFARAMDQCIPANEVGVENPGNIGICLQTNNTTDSLMAMRWAKLTVLRGTRGVNLQLSSLGLLPPDQAVSIRFTLRTSNTSGIPAGSKTYQDTTVTCGPITGGSCGPYYLTDSFGRVSRILGRYLLSDCLAANNLPATLASGNIEFIDVRVINCDTGRAVAVPGVLQ
jgi:hypothetical protein